MQYNPKREIDGFKNISRIYAYVLCELGLRNLPAVGKFRGFFRKSRST